MKQDFLRCSRENLGRLAYRNNDWNFSSISEPIGVLMGRLNGAELVSEYHGRIGDEYRATFFVSPESVCVHFDAGVGVRIEIYGSTADFFEKAYRRICEAFSGKREEQKTLSEV